MVVDMDNSLEMAEQALSREKSEKNGKKEEKERKIPRAFILMVAVLVLALVFAVQFIFTGEEIPEQVPLPPEAQDQFTGQLEMYADMVEDFRGTGGALPQSELDFLGRNDPAVTYTVTGPNAFRLEYFFLDTTFVLERTLDHMSPAPSRSGPDAGPLPMPPDTP